MQFNELTQLEACCLLQAKQARAKTVPGSTATAASVGSWKLVEQRQEEERERKDRKQRHFKWRNITIQLAELACQASVATFKRATSAGYLSLLGTNSVCVTQEIKSLLGAESELKARMVISH